MNCKHCGASIVWRKTAASNGSRRIPLDATQDPAGNITLDANGWAVVHGEGQRSLLDDDDAPRWMTHFATCPALKL